MRLVVHTWGYQRRHPQAKGKDFLSVSPQSPEGGGMRVSLSNRRFRYSHRNKNCIHTSAGPDLMYVLTEGWDSGELTDEVEVGSSKGMD